MELLVDALAVHRLTVLVIEDKITEPLRERVWKKFSVDETRIGYLITCPWCTSMWIGLGVAIARRGAPKQWGLIAASLALSSITGLLEENRQS